MIQARRSSCRLRNPVASPLAVSYETLFQTKLSPNLLEEIETVNIPAIVKLISEQPEICKTYPVLLSTISIAEWYQILVANVLVVEYLEYDFLLNLLNKFLLVHSVYRNIISVAWYKELCQVVAKDTRLFDIETYKDLEIQTASKLELVSWLCNIILITRIKTEPKEKLDMPICFLVYLRHALNSRAKHDMDWSNILDRIGHSCNEKVDDYLQNIEDLLLIELNQE